LVGPDASSRVLTLTRCRVLLFSGAPKHFGRSWSVFGRVAASGHYTLPQDGLALPWHGTVFSNPPYGAATQHWLRKLAGHEDGIALVFARTDTAWFHEAAARATLICFVAGRIKFINGHTGKPAGSPGSGSGSGPALIAFGQKSAEALRQAELGVCVEARS